MEARRWQEEHQGKVADTEDDIEKRCFLCLESHDTQWMGEICKCIGRYYHPDCLYPYAFVHRKCDCKTDRYKSFLFPYIQAALPKQLDEWIKQQNGRNDKEILNSIRRMTEKQIAVGFNLCKDRATKDTLIQQYLWMIRSLSYEFHIQKRVDQRINDNWMFTLYQSKRTHQKNNPWGTEISDDGRILEIYYIELIEDVVSIIIHRYSGSDNIKEDDSGICGGCVVQ